MIDLKNISITAIDRESSSYLNHVKELWRPHSDTLGYFPEGAFNESAEKGHIFVAIDSASKKSIGYLLFRISGEKIIIVHLCTDPKWRGKGVAKKLVNYLIQHTKKYRGIGLNCRRDFAVSKIWPSLGFVAQNDKPGRSRKGTELTYWWFDHGHPNLFSNIEFMREPKISAVIDANIFFDLFSDEKFKDESKALLADWLKSSLELYLTDEILNEINRNTSMNERNRQRKLATKFPFVNFKVSYDEIFEKLKILYPENASESDQSDLRQLAKTIASGTQFFITRDEALLRKANEINANFFVSIIRPVDIITHIDELRHESEYQPVRLAGTITFEFQRIRREQEPELVKIFQFYKNRESKNEFQGQLRRFLSDPANYECSILNKDKKPYGLIVYDRKIDHVLQIPILRTRKDQLTSTIEKFLVIRAVSIACQENRLMTKISEKNLEDSFKSALSEDGFFNASSEWIKLNLALVDTAKNLAKNLEGISSKYGLSSNFINLSIDLLK